MNGIDLILAVDGGGSKTEAALTTTAGERLATVRGGACNLYRDRDGGLAVIAGLWRQCCEAIGAEPDAKVSRTCLSAGLAGVSANGAAAGFHQAFPRFARRCLSSDGYTALVGAFGTEPGALLSIGTGVIGYRNAEDGFRRLGGWGFPAGDRGGGAWLGLRLVGDWLEAREGFGPALDAAPTLLQAIEATVGDHRAAILQWLSAAGAGDLAGLARPLTAAAEAGDPYANGLLDEAADHLCRLALALDPKAQLPLVLAGGLAPTFAPRLSHLLGAGRIAHERMASPLHGAWLIGIGSVAPELPEPQYRPG